MKTDKLCGTIKIYWKWIFPVVHMVIAMLYMNFGIRREPLPFGKMTPAFNINWSEGCEKAAQVLLAGIFGFCMICIAWYILFMLIKKKKILPFILAGIALMISFIVFPGSFSYELDNLVVYSYAVRDMPDYWQSIYLGSIYKPELFTAVP